MGLESGTVGLQHVDIFGVFASHPEMNIYDYQAGIYGSYWYNHGEIPSEELLRAKPGANQGASRIDILQAQDETLYYRYWNRKEVVALAKLPLDGTKVDAFVMPQAKLQMFVDAEEYLPAPKPGVTERPVSFDKDPRRAKRPAAKLKLTVDERSKEFWVAAMPIGPEPQPPAAAEVEMVGSDRLAVELTLQPTDSFRDVGLQVHLDQFHRKLDPGTTQAGHA